MIRAFRLLRAGMKNGLTWAGVRMLPGRFRLMAVRGALHSTFKAWPMKALGMLEVNVDLPLIERLVNGFDLPGPRKQSQRLLRIISSGLREIGRAHV